MGRRIDYQDGPNPPGQQPRTLRQRRGHNDADEIFVIRRTGNDNSALPGGAIELAKS